MKDILPERLLDVLRDRYVAGVANAEAFFNQHEADEDSVTGALGQALAERHPFTYSGPEGTFAVSIRYTKIRGRGPGAPEKRFGTDGMFQISVRDELGNVIREKGLPFQSKIDWAGRDEKLLHQAERIEERLSNGIVIDFSERGYRACTTAAAVESNGDGRRVEERGEKKPLGQVLSRDFLECSVGRIGLFFDPDREEFGTAPSSSTNHLVTTEVQRVRSGDGLG